MIAKPTPRIQFGALPYRRDPDNALGVLLITSRQTRRWIIPKGWPMANLPPFQAAAREALEEAGLIGRIGESAIGSYRYAKRLDTGETVDCEVSVFGLEVEEQLSSWPEQHERKSLWFSIEEAAEAVQETGLRTIILGLSSLLAQR
ncbi:MAG: NUDIX hydrolase [Parvibaculaceae bacterium]